MYRVIAILLSFFLSLPILWSDTIYSKEDILIFDKYVKSISKVIDSKPENLIINTAKFFLGKPYVGSTLETENKENLIVNLRELDCTTFVESCLALSAMVRSQNISFSEYSRQLVMLRYRSQKIDGYSSRLHYSSDWITENEKRVFWKNISMDHGGERISKDINYMSTHPDLYKRLRNNQDNIKKIKEIELNIKKENAYMVIPKRKISQIKELISDGDVILFATSIDGLDYSHMGIAYWMKGELHFIHASSASGKVIVEPRTLDNYCNISKKCIGISLIRVN